MTHTVLIQKAIEQLMTFPRQYITDRIENIKIVFFLLCVYCFRNERRKKLFLVCMWVNCNFIVPFWQKNRMKKNFQFWRRQVVHLTTLCEVHIWIKFPNYHQRTGWDTEIFWKWLKNHQIIVILKCSQVSIFWITFDENKI